MIMCPPGQEMDPTLGCACSDMQTIRETYYPAWATPYDIDMAFSEGYQARLQWSRIRVCPADNDGNSAKCEQGFYWNELACQCFAMA